MDNMYEHNVCTICMNKMYDKYPLFFFQATKGQRRADVLVHRATAGHLAVRPYWQRQEREHQVGGC